MTTQKQCLQDTAGTRAYELTGVVTADMKPVHAQSRASLSMERDVRLRSLPQLRKLSAAGEGGVSLLQAYSPDEFTMLQREAEVIQGYLGTISWP